MARVIKGRTLLTLDREKERHRDPVSNMIFKLLRADTTDKPTIPRSWLQKGWNHQYLRPRHDQLQNTAMPSIPEVRVIFQNTGQIISFLCLPSEQTQMHDCDL